MSHWSKETIDGLDIALNEARLLGVEVDVPAREVGVTLQVLTLPEVGPVPNDSRILLVLSPVERIMASLRHGLWNDETASVELFPIDSLFDVVHSFHGCPIYGWEFFDAGAKEFNSWAGRLSLDWQSGTNGLSHTLDLFQEGDDEGQQRHLDLRIWFDGMTIYTPAKDIVSVSDFIAGGRRWWRAMRQGDARTTSSGIVSLSNGSKADDQP